jgi:hypothetical protein
MNKTCMKIFNCLLVSLAITACGGGDAPSAPGNTAGENEAGGGNNNGGGNNGGGNDGGGNVGTLLRGVASQGGPMAGVSIVAVELNSQRGASTTTRADGTFELNISNLTPPLKLFASNSRTAESFALTNVAFAGQTVAHINEATHAVTQAMGNNPTQARHALLSDSLVGALSNYVGNSATNFNTDPNYRADSTGIDGVLGQVRLAFVGNGILLENRTNPTQRVVLDTTVATPPAVNLPATPANQSVSVAELRNLLLAFEAALAVQSTNASKFDNVLHPDFVDTDGFNAQEIAEISSATNIKLERFEILRCFADTTSTQDRCLVRAMLYANAPDETLDFGNPNFAEVALADKFDVIVERRNTGGVVGPLKIAGGQFRPHAVNSYLLHLTDTTIQAAGTVFASTTRSDLVLNIDPTKSDVRAAQLIRTQNTTTSTLLGLTKPDNGQCAGVTGLVRNPLNSIDCSRQFTPAGLGNLEVDSRDGRLSLALQTSNAAQSIQVPFVRVKSGASVRPAHFPTLSTNSLQALHAYGRATLPPTALNIELSPPNGFNEVCITTDTEEMTPSVCVRKTRQVSIPNNLLPSRRSSYVLYTVDNEGNRFANRYNLQ